MPLRVAARTGMAVRNFEFDLAFGNGEILHLLGNAVPLLDEEGHTRGAVAAFLDVTEHKRSEEHTRQVQKLESIGLLAGGIAHDFNNLLTGILGNASLLLDGAPTDDRESLEAIVSSSERAAHLTRQLLAYSGKGQFVIREMQLSREVREIVDLLRLSIPKSVDLRLDLQERLPVIRIDPAQLQQITMNLVSNAGEAIGEGKRGTISVSTGVRDIGPGQRDFFSEEIAPAQYVYLEVSDTGAGMDPKTMARIFDPFFTTKFTGRGLGLAAVSGIIRSQGGAILVRSEPGRGSTFTVLFRAAQIEREAAGQAAPGSFRGTVLVVDDEDAVRRIHVLRAAQGRLPGADGHRWRKGPGLSSGGNRFAGCRCAGSGHAGPGRRQAAQGNRHRPSRGEGPVDHRVQRCRSPPAVRFPPGLRIHPEAVHGRAADRRARKAPRERPPVRPGRSIPPAGSSWRGQS